MTVESFMFRNKFKEGLTDEDVQIAIQSINADWSGVPTLWRVLPKKQREDKINLTMNYLVAWWLADYSPSLVNGVFTTGGVPLLEKEIGGVRLKFRDQNVQDAYSKLKSNYFGLRALDLLLSAPEKYQLY
jgi:hypothetical protein